MLKEGIKAFGCISEWSDEQVPVLANKASDLLGPIAQWGSKDFLDMGPSISHC